MASLNIKRLKPSSQRLEAMGQLGAGVPLYADSSPSELEIAAKDLVMGTGNLNFRGPRVVGENTILRTMKAGFSVSTCQNGPAKCGNNLAVRVTGNTGNGPHIAVGTFLKGPAPTSVYYVGTTSNHFNISPSSYYDELSSHSTRVDMNSSTISSGTITINGLMSSFVFADSRQIEGSFHNGVPNVEQLQMVSLNPTSDCNLLNDINKGCSIHFGTELMGPLIPSTTQLVEVESEAFKVLEVRDEPTAIEQGYYCFYSIEGKNPTNYTLPTTDGEWGYSPNMQSPNYIPFCETLQINVEIEVQNDESNPTGFTARLHAVLLNASENLEIQQNNINLDEAQANIKSQGSTNSITLRGNIPAIDGLGNGCGTLVAVYVSFDPHTGGTTNQNTVLSASCTIQGMAAEGVGRRSPMALLLAQDVSQDVVIVIRACATIAATMNSTVREAVGGGNLRDLAKTEGGEFIAKLQQIVDSDVHPFCRQSQALTLKECMLSERHPGIGKLYASGFTDFLSGLAQGLGGVLSLGAPILDTIMPGVGQLVGVAGDAITRLGSSGKGSLIIHHDGCLLCNGPSPDGSMTSVLSEGHLTLQGTCGGHSETAETQSTEQTVLNILDKTLTNGIRPNSIPQLEIRRLCDGSPNKKKIKLSSRGPSHPQHKFKPRVLDKPSKEIYPITREEFNNLSQETANHSASTALAMSITGRRLALATCAFPTVDGSGKPAKLVLIHSHQQPLDDVSYHILKSSRGYDVIIDGRFDIQDGECAGQIAEIVEKDKRLKEYPVITLEGIGKTDLIDGNSFGMAMLSAIGGAWSPKVAMTGAIYISQTNGALVLPVSDIANKTELANDQGRILLAPFTSESVGLMNANPEAVIPAAALLNTRIYEAPALMLCNSGGDVASSIVSCTMMLSKRSGKEQTDPELSSEAIKRKVKEKGAANVTYDVEGEKVPLFDINWWKQPQIWNRVGPTERGGLGSTHEKVEEHIANYSYKKLHGLARTIIMYNRSHAHTRLGGQKGVKLRRLVQQLDEEMPAEKPRPPQATPAGRADREGTPRAEAPVVGRRPRKDRLIAAIHGAMLAGLVPRRDGEMAIDALEDPSTASRREKEALTRVKEILDENEAGV